MSHQIHYLYSFRGASWFIPCEILEKLDNNFYKIEYIDPIILDYDNEIKKEIKTVKKDSLKFPSFIDLVIP